MAELDEKGCSGDCDKESLEIVIKRFKEAQESRFDLFTKLKMVALVHDIVAEHPHIFTRINIFEETSKILDAYNGLIIFLENSLSKLPNNEKGEK